MEQQGDLFRESITEDFTDPKFDGETYNEERDQIRLGKQLQKVFDCLSEERGGWLTIPEISQVTGIVAHQSISARIRDLRKDKFGGHNVEHRNIGGGTWEYRMVAK